MRVISCRIGTMERMWVKATEAGLREVAPDCCQSCQVLALRQVEWNQQ